MTVMDIEKLCTTQRRNPQQTTALPRYTAAQFLRTVSALLGTNPHTLRQRLHEGEFLSDVLRRSGISAAELRQALAAGPRR